MTGDPGSDTDAAALARRRDYLIRQALLRVRAGLHLPDDQTLDGGTALDATTSLAFLDAASALTMPRPHDAAETGGQVTALREGTLFAFAGKFPGWGDTVLSALAGAWGSDASRWPAAVPLSELRAILTAAGLVTIPVPPDQPAPEQEAADVPGRELPAQEESGVHRVLAASCEALAASPGGGRQGTRVELLSACPPQPGLEPVLSVRLAAEAAGLVVAAAAADDRPACEAAIAAAVRWCDHRTEKTTKAAGTAADGAWIMDGGPAAAAARDAAFAAHWHGTADALRALSESQQDAAALGRFTRMADGYAQAAAASAAKAAKDPDAFLAAITAVYHKHT